jgi:hypothetical protein
VPKIGRCRSGLFGDRCGRKRWHIGWHEFASIPSGPHAWQDDLAAFYERQIAFERGRDGRAADIATVKELRAR